MADDQVKTPVDTVSIDDIIGAPQTSAASAPVVTPSSSLPLPDVEPLIKAAPVVRRRVIAPEPPMPRQDQRMDRDRVERGNERVERGNERVERGNERNGNRSRPYVQNRGRSRYMRQEPMDNGDYNGGNDYTPNRSINPDRSFEFGGEIDGRVIPDAGVQSEVIKGILDTSTEGHGVLRPFFAPSERDAYISTSQIRRFGLRPGDIIEGPARAPKENERYWGLLKVETVNGFKAEDVGQRVKFSNLTPVHPDQKIKLETGNEPLSTRMIDLVAPIGKGQRGLIVSPPKAGKTSIIKEIATGVAANYPEIHLMAVLIGERPEEVTEIRRHMDAITKGKGEVAASNFDELPEDQARVAELAIERAKRLVELGNDVVILLDSITRLARAYNLAIPTSGRTLSGGFDPAALTPPKKFFGAARNFEEFDTPSGKKRGSLTIIGTALVDTGSRMDDLVYEEFKGTGNMELILDRMLGERRIYPAIDIQKSGTRREELLFSQTEYQSIVMMRRMVDILNKDERTMLFIDNLKKSKSNTEFLASLKEG